MQMMIDNENIFIKINRKPNKNIYMRFLNSQILEVNCNNFVSEKYIAKILTENEKTLIKMLKQKQKEEEQDKYFWYLGKKYIPVYNEEIKKITFDQEFIYTKNEKMLNSFYKNECLRIFKSEVERISYYFSNIPKFSLKLRYMKTRWGVNNRRDNSITLNTELLKKDIDLLDYVIIHELCHFYEANHSQAFWDHVARYYPKYKEARKRLRS